MAKKKPQRAETWTLLTRRGLGPEPKAICVYLGLLYDVRRLHLDLIHSWTDVSVLAFYLARVTLKFKHIFVIINNSYSLLSQIYTIVLRHIVDDYKNKEV